MIKSTKDSSCLLIEPNHAFPHWARKAFPDKQIRLVRIEFYDIIVRSHLTIDSFVPNILFVKKCPFPNHGLIYLHCEPINDKQLRNFILKKSNFKLEKRLNNIHGETSCKIFRCNQLSKSIDVTSPPACRFAICFYMGTECSSAPYIHHNTAE